MELKDYIALALIIERLIALRKSKVIPAELLPEVLNLYPAKKIDAAANCFPPC